MSVARVTLVFVLALGLPTLGAAQGLGDAAARERARRDGARKPAPARTFTNEDLSEGRPPGAGASESVAPAEGGAPVSTSEAPPEESRRTQEAPLIAALDEAQGQVASAEARVKSLQDKLNPMSSDFIFGATGSNSANEDAEVREQLTQAQAQLLEARQAVTASAQALADFRQGRRAPPANE
jgi:hypothetical protein